MISAHLLHRRSGRLVRTLIILVAFGPTLALGAEDRFYVTPDGQKVGLIRSETEFAVTLRAPREAGQVAKRLELTGQGELQALPGTLGKVHLLRGAKTSLARRDAVRKDPAIADVRPVYRFAGIDSPLISTGEILVRVQADLSEARRQQLWSDYHVEAFAPLDGLPGVYVLGPFSLDVDEVLLAEALADDERAVWAQPNFRRETRLAQVPTPSDPLYAQQWHLQAIKAPEAWAVTQGQGIIFGMNDDSCDIDHPDLIENYLGRAQDLTVLPNTPGFDDPRPKQIDDRHGTAVMGLAVARGNTLGGRGVAPLAKFAPSRGLFEFGTTDRQIAASYIFSLGQDADVHINSWGSSFDFFPPQVLIDAIQRVFNEGRRRGDIDGDGENDPLGMVVLFASGNDNRQIHRQLALASLPEAISVGATDGEDRRAEFSNFGEVDIMAPGVGVITTDNRDINIDPGYNVGGFDSFSGQPEIEASGNYTGTFGGTSAACPIAAGVAGLVLAANPRLTASDVRLILEHTADRVWPEEALYDPITSRSFFYGYGRVNAAAAVAEAQRSLTDGLTWPDPPADGGIFRNDPFYGSGIFFFQNYGATDVLVVESQSPFEFIPQEGSCYDADQPGCESASLEPLPGGVQVRAAGCGFSCGQGTPDPCRFGGWNCVFFEPEESPKYFGVFARNQESGRYSFGVKITNFDVTSNMGQLAGRGMTGGGGNIPLAGERPPTPEPSPAVNVNVSPLRGRSPLTVNFTGNATSVHPIDESKITWDFDINDDVEVNARTRQASHVYTVGDVSKTFVARFSMTDVNGNEGSQEVAIFVEADVDEDQEPVGSGLLRIVVGLPGSPGSNVSVGKAPFTVLLSVDASDLPGTLQSVAWDLGDGFRATTLTAPHTYYNDGTTDLRLPITATVNSVTSTGLIATSSATRVITVQPGQRPQNVDDPHLPGTGAQGPGGQASPCGAMGMIPLTFCLMSLVCLRKFRDD